jgi:hypothetical protein
LGVQLHGDGGSLVNLDFARFNLEGDPIQPGQEVTLVAKLKLPMLPAYPLKFDLVSEHVAWFGQAGRLKPVEIPSSKLLPAA